MKHLFIGTYSAGRAKLGPRSQKSQSGLGLSQSGRILNNQPKMNDSWNARRWGIQNVRAGPAGRVCLFRLPECVQEGCWPDWWGLNTKCVPEKARKQKSENKKGRQGANDRDKKRRRIMAANVYLVSGYWCENLSVPWICKGNVMLCPTAWSSLSVNDSDNTPQAPVTKKHS